MRQRDQLGRVVRGAHGLLNVPRPPVPPRPPRPPFLSFHLLLSPSRCIDQSAHRWIQLNSAPLSSRCIDQSAHRWIQFNSASPPHPSPVSPTHPLTVPAHAPPPDARVRARSAPTPPYGTARSCSAPTPRAPPARAIPGLPSATLCPTAQWLQRPQRAPLQGGFVDGSNCFSRDCVGHGRGMRADRHRPRSLGRASLHVRHSRCFARLLRMTLHGF